MATTASAEHEPREQHIVAGLKPLQLQMAGVAPCDLHYLQEFPVMFQRDSLISEVLMILVTLGLPLIKSEESD